jgi:hypothetical protein
MPTHLSKRDRAPDVGSLDWLMRTEGHLTFLDRVSLLLGGLSAMAEGIRLGLRARKDERRNVPLSVLEPPDTAMVGAARSYLEAHADRAMVNHCFRTAFWTLVVLHQHLELAPKDIETAWVAALLHDVGLEVPPSRGDFSMGGIEVLKTLALDLGWGEEQTHQACEAIAANLSTRVNPARAGMVAWAMNVGGIGELGFGPHRAQMHPARIQELESRYPRDGFRTTATRLIEQEVTRIPDGRFALLGRFFPLIMLR